MKAEVLSDYLARGWPIFPCHGVADGRCLCGQPCTSPGKHPAVPAWRTTASTDPKQVAAWSAAGARNWALAIPPGLVVVDIDPRNGGSLEAVAALGLPPTWSQATGGGGWHLAYECPVKVPGKHPTLPGVDFKGYGGYILLDPSMHVSGAGYVVLVDLEPAPAPLWLVELAVPEHTPVDFDDEAATPEAVARCREYLTRVPAGVGQTWAAALAAWSFGLNTEQRFAALTEWDREKWPQPWSPEQLRRKAVEAAKSDRPKGWRLAEDGALAGYMAETLEALTPETAASSGDSWESALLSHPTKDGPKIDQSPANLALIFARHPEWGCLSFDAFAQRARWTKSPPFDLIRVEPGEELNVDTHFAHAQRWLKFRYYWRGLANVGKAHVQDALCIAAKMRTHHPARDLLGSLVWDGVPRLDSWLARYLGAEDDPRYLAAYGSTWLMSAAKRVFEPGSQADVMLVLEGRQGTFKSSALRTLALRDEWFDDQVGDFGDKDTALGLSGLLIVEHSELAQLRRTAIEQVKTFVSRRNDRYRAPYERTTTDHFRQCIFAGSTNADRYFVDPTGSRRFAPVRCGRILLSELTRDREALWAEAVSRWRAGALTYVADQRVVRLAEAAQEERHEADPWEDAIAAWLEAPVVLGGRPELRQEVALDELWGVVGVPTDRRDHAGTCRLGAVVRRLGWERFLAFIGGRRIWKYRRSVHVPTCVPTSEK